MNMQAVRASGVGVTLAALSIALGLAAYLGRPDASALAEANAAEQAAEQAIRESSQQLEKLQALTREIERLDAELRRVMPCTLGDPQRRELLRLQERLRDVSPMLDDRLMEPLRPRGHEPQRASRSPA